MIRHRLVTVFLIFGLFSLAAGCATTRTTHIWKDPAFTKADLKNVGVIAVAANEGNRRIAEDEFVKQLQEKGIKATASYIMFSLDRPKSKDDLKTLLAPGGFDSVLIARMVDKTTEQKYYPPTVTYTGPPRAYYGGWYGYYDMGYNYYTTPGYTQTNDIVKLECNVYDFASEKLLYSGLSETTIARGSKADIEGAVKVILKSILE